MKNYPLIGVITMVLSGCSSPDQVKFESSVNDKIQIGMSENEAVNKLSESHFTCTGNGPVDCSRIQQGVPYSCIERVLLHSFPGSGTIAAIDIQDIQCGGL